MQTIDLSYTLTEAMPVFPGDDKVEIKQQKTLKKDFYNLISFSSGMHSGTHIDVPKHLLQDKRTVDEFLLDKFIGNGVLFDVRKEAEIGFRPEYENRIIKDDIVLLYTGFADLYNEPKKYYSQYPVMTEELADFLINKRIKILGMDTPSPDKTPFHIHKKLLEHDILILENLTNLQALTKAVNFQIIAVPLKIKAEASLVRAFARAEK